MGGGVGGGVNTRERRRGSHSFTHNFLKTEWGCLHKAKTRMMARKDFVAVHFPTLYREWGWGGGGWGGGGGGTASHPGISRTALCCRVGSDTLSV